MDTNTLNVKTVPGIISINVLVLKEDPFYVLYMVLVPLNIL